MSRTYFIRIQEGSQIGESRRVAQHLAQELHFNETEAGKLSIIVSEMASNLVKHTAGKGGELILQAIQSNGHNGVETIAIDRGPGMSRVEECLRDGFSSSGTQGIGLGGIRRQSSTFDLYSGPGVGTIVVSRLWVDGNAPDEAWNAGAICKPVEGETVCGDAWGFELTSSGPTVLVADGLGHGPAAHDASSEAVQVLHSNSTRSITEILQLSNSALKKTRGAAVGLLRMDPATRKARFTGVGNISGSIVTPGQVRSMVSMNGIVGHEFRRVQEFDYEVVRGAAIILHSDGLLTRWDLSRYPGILAKHPTIIAAALYRDFARGRDDLTVVVLKENLRNARTAAA